MLQNLKHKNKSKMSLNNMRRYFSTFFITLVLAINFNSGENILKNEAIKNSLLDNKSSDSFNNIFASNLIVTNPKTKSSLKKAPKQNLIDEEKENYY
ncbi:hypothetical protein NUSPORA_00013 [Nucleospora cyclopteri]